MKTITYEELEKRNFDSANISNHKLIDGKCVKCDKLFEYGCVKTFLRTRKEKLCLKSIWQTCPKCWLISQTSQNPEWIRKNSQAQLIAQNKPEQKKKNAEGVSRSWDKERKKKGSDYLKKRWKEDSVYAAKMLLNINWTQFNDQRFRDMMLKSAGIGGLRGKYKDIYYDSALELSYVFWCEDNNIKIKRYDLAPIDYLDEKGEERKYFPDFIIEDDVVVEIKGSGLFFKKNYLRNICKLKALREKYKKCQMIMSEDDCLKENYKKAKKWHYENCEKKNDKI